MDVNRQTSGEHCEGKVEALQESELAQDERLAMTVHELRTPLHGILGLTETLLCGAQGEVPPQQRESLEIIYSCAQRLSRMTESLLDLSCRSSEAGNDGQEPALHCVASHLDEALSDLRVIARKSSTRLVMSVPPNLEIRYQREELESVVRVLIDNAIKNTPGGIVQVLVAKWESSTSGGFQLAVRDNGSGIPAEVHGRIFEPFFSYGDPEAEDRKGVGLGLSIATKAVERLGGKIILESAVGRGATFTVLVPEDRGAERLESLYEPWPPFQETPEEG